MQLLVRVAFFGISSLDRDINLTIGIILLTILVGVHGLLHPFKNEIQNYQEVTLFFNLQVMYRFSIYGRESISKNIVNILTALAAVHFISIVLHHIIIYTCSGVTRNKLGHSFNKLTQWIKCSCNRPSIQEFEFGNIVNSIPEVTHRYNEFQESLVGYSH